MKSVDVKIEIQIHICSFFSFQAHSVEVRLKIINPTHMKHHLCRITQVRLDW